MQYNRKCIRRHQNAMAVLMCRRMSYEDFVANFSQVEMCMTVFAFENMRMSVGNKIQWQMTSHEGSWKKYVNAGGCRNYQGIPKDRTLSPLFLFFMRWT